MQSSPLRNSKKTTENNFRILVTAINACDLLLGVYLLIISIKYSVIGENFVEVDMAWRISKLCYFIAALSLFSTTLSCPFIVLLSIS